MLKELIKDTLINEIGYKEKLYPTRLITIDYDNYAGHEQYINLFIDDGTYRSCQYWCPSDDELKELEEIKKQEYIEVII